jgi:hypothetical protein
MANTSARTRVSTLRFTPEQYKMIAQRAERCKVSVAVWIRTVLLQVASRPAREGYHRVREPNGELS